MAARAVDPCELCRHRSPRRRLAAALLRDLCRLGLLLLVLHVLTFHLSLVRGSSMQPNIEDGDRLLVDRLTYGLADVQRFDVVILTGPGDSAVDYVKRVVGLPGDHVELRHGRLHVNGVRLPEPFARVLDDAGDGDWHVPAAGYFVLGDNRPVSSDSREGWFVAREQIKGKVRACLWPPSRLRAF